MKIDNKSWDTLSAPGDWQHWYDGLPEWQRSRLECQITTCGCRVKTHLEQCECIELGEDEPS